MKLTKVGISNYRSIGETPVWIDLETKIDIMVGPNNSGKSNALRGVGILRQFLSNSLKLSTLEEEDFHLRNRSEAPVFHVDMRVNDKEYPIPKKAEMASLSFSMQDEFQFDPPLYEEISEGITAKEHVRNFLAKYHQEVKFESRNRYLIVKNTDVLPAVINSLARRFIEATKAQLPESLTVPQFREIREPIPGKKGGYQVNGTGIVDVLDSWKDPGRGLDELKVRFNNVQRFLRKILHLPEAQLEVTHDKMIMVNSNALRLTPSA
jgi:predicted ATP-dependent endonuclease of OLD family